MKSRLLLFFCVVSSLLTHAQVPAWQWAARAGGAGLERAWGSSADASGNVYVIGTYQSTTITFGTITLNNTNTAGAEMDIFIVKYSPSGTAIWAKSIGGLGTDYGRSICVEKDGNIFITGSFLSPTITVGSTTFTNSFGPNNTSREINFLVAKLDPSGQVIWAKSGAGQSEGISVAADTSGNVFVLGNFYSDTTTFGSTTYIDTANGDYTPDVFLLKYDASGNLLWSRTGMGNYQEMATGVCTDAQGNVTAAGFFYSPTFTVGATTLTNAAPIASPGLYSDIFMVKYDPAGNLVWAKGIGGPGQEDTRSICADQAGNSIIGGSYTSTLLALGSTTLTNAGNYDGLIAKLDPAGNFLWARSASGPFNDESSTVSADASGNIYAAGYYLDSLHIGTAVIHQVGQKGFFIVKFDPSGTIQWSTSSDGYPQDRITSTCNGYAGGLTIVGWIFKTHLHYGTTDLVNADGSGNTADMFIASMSTAPNGIRELENDPAAIRIYPNPSAGKTILLSDKPLNHAFITVIDNSGKIVKQVVAIVANSGQPISLSLSSLDPGIYIIRLEQDGELIGTKKLIIPD